MDRAESTLLCVAMDPKDERDGDGEDQRDDEERSEAEAEEADRESSEPPPPKSEPKRDQEASAKAKRSSKAKREGKSSAREERKQPAAAPSKGSSQAVLAAVLALAAGVAVGWFGHQARAKSQLKAESGPAAAGSSGPCGQWEQKICADTGGEKSAACQQAKGAAELLTPGTCETALTNMPATMERIKAGRATCDNLVTKLCSDLPKDSQACAMVKERTPSFPTERCKGMLEQYDQVLGQLKMIDSHGGGMMGRPPPGAAPHGGPGGPAPQGAPPAPAPGGGPPPGHP